MGLHKAVCSKGELGNGRIKKPGNGTAYTSANAARQAIAKYKGPEVLTVKPMGAPRKAGAAQPEPVKAHGGARKRSGVQMPSGQKAVAVTTTMDPVDKATLIEFGGGKLAVGLRKAAELVRMHQQG